MEIDKPDSIENRSGKDRRRTFLNGLDRRQPAGQGEDRLLADSGVLVEREESTLSQSDTGIPLGPL